MFTKKAPTKTKKGKKILTKLKDDFVEEHGEVPSIVMSGLEEDLEKVDDAVIITDYTQQDPIAGWVSTNSFMLNAAIGFPIGLGIPMPGMIEVVGTESAGKSFLLLVLLANVQRIGGWSALIDVEETLTHQFGSLAGLNMHPEAFRYLRMHLLESCVVAAQRMFERHVAAAPDMPFAIGIDSLASTTVEQERDNPGEPARALHARIMSRAVRRGLLKSFYRTLAMDDSSKILIPHPVLLVVTNQLKATMNIIPGMPMLDSFGGRAMKYNSRVRIELTRAGKIQDKDKDPSPVGFRCHARILKNKVNQDGRDVAFDFRYASGIEDYFPVLDFMERYDGIEKSGNYYVWDDRKLYPNAMREFLISHPREWEKLKQQTLLVMKRVWRDRTIPFVEESVEEEDDDLVLK